MKRLTIYDNLVLDPGTAGYLDWATGISRINASYSEWQELNPRRRAKQITDRDIELREAASHEYAHFIQITTTGYLYRFAIRLYELLSRCVPQPKFVVPGPDLKPPEVVAKQLAEHLAILDDVGPHGITSRAVIESQAFYIQKGSTLYGLSHKHYITMLDEAPGPEYRHAYDLAAERLGARAFKAFPVLTSLALCTLDPAESFVELVEAVAARKLSYTHTAGTPPFAELASTVCINTIGTSVDMLKKLPQHPVYTPVVSELYQKCMQSSRSVLDFLTNLHRRQPKDLVSATLRPILFNRELGAKQSSLLIPSGLWSNKTKEERENDGHDLIVLAAVSASFLGNIEPEY
jgi:hypothetical protein